MKIDEKHNRKLLVEGNDDQHVIWALCERYKIPETFDIIDCEGISNLYEAIPVRLKQSGIETLGIIIDADSDLKKRWNSIKDLLSNQGFIVPDETPEDGLVVSDGKIKIGVWIMPDNKVEGMLEDFMSFLIPTDDELLPLVDSTLDEIESRKLNKYAPIHKPKARIHSWLAWQEDPGTPMGQSITKRYLTTDNDCCIQLINWIQKLFNE